MSEARRILRHCIHRPWMNIYCRILRHGETILYDYHRAVLIVDYVSCAMMIWHILTHTVKPH